MVRTILLTGVKETPSVSLVILQVASNVGTQFYNEAVRKTVIAFGTLFNNIELKKTVDGQTIETEKVPLAYGPKQVSFIDFRVTPLMVER